MRCPICQAAARVADSRQRPGTIRRVRRCKRCGYRMVTWESTTEPIIESRKQLQSEERDTFLAEIET